MGGLRRISLQPGYADVQNLQIRVLLETQFSVTLRSQAMSETGLKSPQAKTTPNSIEQDSPAGVSRPGRKPGKHSSANYVQTSIYLPRELKNKVRAKLYEKGMEMSGVVEEMLKDWLARQRS